MGVEYDLHVGQHVYWQDSPGNWHLGRISHVNREAHTGAWIYAFDPADGFRTFGGFSRGRFHTIDEHREWEAAQPKKAPAMSPTTRALADLLYSLGWQNTGDAQLSELDAAIFDGRIAEAINAEKHLRDYL